MPCYRMVAQRSEAVHEAKKILMETSKGAAEEARRGKPAPILTTAELSNEVGAIFPKYFARSGPR